MQASDRTLAERYARALFACAVERGEQAAVSADLNACAGALAGALPLLRDPRVPQAQKKALVRDGVQGKVAPLTADFLELLIDKKRFDVLSVVARDFEKLVDRKRGVVRARVRSARPLAPADRDRLRARLEAFAGTGVEIDEAQDPDLLGGVAVRLGDWVLDSSLSGRLENLKEAIGGD